MDEFTCTVVYFAIGTNEEVARRIVHGMSKHDIYEKALRGITIAIYPAQILDTMNGKVLWRLGEWTKEADRIPITPHYY